jgi:hypothetical protein
VTSRLVPAERAASTMRPSQNEIRVSMLREMPLVTSCGVMAMTRKRRHSLTT